MLLQLAGIIVLLTGLAFIGFSVWAAVAPQRARASLKLFAISQRAHLIELALRILVGAAFVVFYQHLVFPRTALLFGLVLILSSAVLIILPWRWHQRFAALVIPYVDRFLLLYILLCFVLGVLVLTAWGMPLLSSV